MMTDKHKELMNTAIKWLYGRGCSVFANEVPTWNGNADALGIITRDKPVIYYIEAKASRSDLLCFKQKCCYKRTEEVFKIGSWDDERKKNFYQGVCEYTYPNDIDYFYFIVSDEVKIKDTDYPLWGIINENGEVIRRAKKMLKRKDEKDLLQSIAHVLVYKVFGKMYLTNSI